MDGPQLEILGLLAGTLTTAAFVPQVLRVWRTRSTHDISLAMFLLFSLGVLLWLVYGIAIHSTPVVAANGATLVLSIAILVAKLRFK
jgi:MtN3 and saliva related transmembrane protein